MISVLVLYPNVPGSRFDMDYYVNRHLKLVRERLDPIGLRSMIIVTETASDPSAGLQAYRLIADERRVQITPSSHFRQ